MHSLTDGKLKYYYSFSTRLKRQGLAKDLSSFIWLINCNLLNGFEDEPNNPMIFPGTDLGYEYLCSETLDCNFLLCTGRHAWNQVSPQHLFLGALSAAPELQWEGWEAPPRHEASMCSPSTPASSSALCPPRKLGVTGFHTLSQLLINPGLLKDYKSRTTKENKSKRQPFLNIQ